MRFPSASDTSRSRHASADVRISARGYHLNGRRTSSASCPKAASSRTRPSAWRSAPPDVNGTCAVQTRTRAIFPLLHARDGVVLRGEKKALEGREARVVGETPRQAFRLRHGRAKGHGHVPESGRAEELLERRRGHRPHVREIHPEPAHRI